MNANNDIKESERNEFLTMLSELQTIPAHDPDRFETTDGLDNPNCTNNDRVRFAADALQAFKKSCQMEEKVETAASDLICDLLHLLHASDSDLPSVIRIGINDFLCEAGCLENR